MINSSKQIIKQFCNETTFHGFHEAYNGHSVCLKLFWIIIISCGGAVTAFQIYRSYMSYMEVRTKTNIIPLPEDIDIKQPPMHLCAVHWYDWVNSSKVKELGFDLDTFLYAMSYYNYVVTVHEFNVSEAREKLTRLMSTHKIFNMYDLASALSVTVPKSIVLWPSIHFSRYLRCNLFRQKSTCQMCFLINVNDTTTNSLTIKVISGFWGRKEDFYYDAYVKLFNYTLKNEYSISTCFLADGSDRYWLLGPLYEYDCDGDDSLGYMDLLDLVNSRNDKPKITFYRWTSTAANNFCNNSNDFKHPVHCTELCQNQYKLTHFQALSTLWFTNKTVNDFNALCPDVHYETSTNEGPYYSIKPNETDFILAMEKYELCKETCINSCDRWLYQYQTFETWQPEGVIDRIILSTENQKRNKIWAMISSPAYSWEDVVGNIGGLLGLWIGGSILSFIHVFYIFCFIPLENFFLN